MRAPHRRDISARQDLLGKELRQLFDDYTGEDMPDELLKLAQQLQGAFEKSSAEMTAKRDGNGHAPEGDASEQTLQSRSE